MDSEIHLSQIMWRRFAEAKLLKRGPGTQQTIFKDKVRGNELKDAGPKQLINNRLFVPEGMEQPMGETEHIVSLWGRAKGAKARVLLRIGVGKLLRRLAAVLPLLCFWIFWSC